MSKQGNQPMYDWTAWSIASLKTWQQELTAVIKSIVEGRWPRIVGSTTIDDKSIRSTTKEMHAVFVNSMSEGANREAVSQDCQQWAMVGFAQVEDAEVVMQQHEEYKLLIILFDTTSPLSIPHSLSNR